MCVYICYIHRYINPETDSKKYQAFEASSRGKSS